MIRKQRVGRLGGELERVDQSWRKIFPASSSEGIREVEQKREKSSVSYTRKEIVGCAMALNFNEL